MALLFCDSFDHYDTAHIQDKYNTTGGHGVDIIAGSGRGGTSAMRSLYNSTVLRPIPPLSTVISGFAYKNLGRPTRIFALFSPQSADPEIAVSFDASGALTASRWDGALLGTTAPGIVLQSAYVYLEIKIVCALDATGSVTIRANGFSVLSVQNVRTMTRMPMATAVGFSSDNGFFDDFYICDTTGAVNADFLGDVKVALAMPNGNGRVNTWAQTGGTPGQHYTSVNEVPPNDDTSYVSSSTVSAADLYTIASVGAPAAIVGVQLVSLAKKDDAGTRVLSLGFGNGTTEAFDAGTSLGTDYTFVRRMLDTNPLTNAPWAPADLTGAQIGVSVVS